MTIDLKPENNTAASRKETFDRGTMCERCILNDGMPGIYLDEQGECNNCKTFDNVAEKYPLNKESEQRLNETLEQIKEEGKGKPYDCIAGVSGGTDSTYTLYKAKQLGLRPLAVHFDNGWNSEVAVRNIKNTLDALDIDLWTYVVDYDEYKDIQLSFLKASVPSVEMPTDLAIRSIMYQVSDQFDIDYFLSGNCFRAEGIVPNAWGYKDGRLIKSLQKKFGSKKLRSFPNLTLFDFAYYSIFKNKNIVRLLNYFDYSKEQAKETIRDAVNWSDYGGHHHESIYTRFFQSYIAPRKFNMDQSYITYSAQVRQGRMSKEEALEQVGHEEYSDFQLQEDRRYIAKKLGITVDRLDALLDRPPKTIFDYPSYYPLIKSLEPFIRFAHKFNLLNGIFQGGRFT